MNQYDGYRRIFIKWSVCIQKHRRGKDKEINSPYNITKNVKTLVPDGYVLSTQNGYRTYYREHLYLEVGG